MIARSPISSIGTVQNRAAVNRTVVLRYRFYLEQKQYAATTSTFAWLPFDGSF